MTTYTARIEWDEDGCYLLINTDLYERPDYRFKLNDPEQLYDAVKGGIGPWLKERELARREYHSVRVDAFRCDPDESGGLEEAWRDAVDLMRKAEKEGAL